MFRLPSKCRCAVHASIYALHVAALRRVNAQTIHDVSQPGATVTNLSSAAPSLLPYA